MKKKPCPFCGFKTVRYYSNDYFDIGYQCKKCGATVHFFDIKTGINIMSGNYGKDEADEKWNKRVKT